MRYSTLFLCLVVACGDVTAPHEGDYNDATIYGARVIEHPATLDSLWQIYTEVSDCLGMPVDRMRFDGATFFAADSMRLDGEDIGGAWKAEYIYAVDRDRPRFWYYMRHELVHLRTWLEHPEANPLIEQCAPMDG